MDTFPVIVMDRARKPSLFSNMYCRKYLINKVEF